MNIILTLSRRWAFSKICLKSYCTSMSNPDYDVEYFCDKNNFNEIQNNVNIRKGLGNISLVLDLHENLKSTPITDSSYLVIRNNLYKELSKLPNKTHPSVQKYHEDPVTLHTLNEKRQFTDTPLEFSVITQYLNLIRTNKLGQTCGHKSYYFLSELAELEEALIKYSVTALLKENFQLVSVPDILPSNVLESCGMTVNTDRTQIYSLDPVHHGPDLYLSGTAEMSLAGLLVHSVHKRKALPLKFAAVSRCYRAETSNTVEERGIYRVHQFTKVEMFAVTTPEHSDGMLEYLREIQEKLFIPLGIHMRVLDMPPHELGAPAFRKYDIEAWMPGRNSYGEISSCSNCIDYQSRRLHIKYEDDVGLKYVHTLNGTACAVPRMLIALLETHQQPKGKIFIPKTLQPFMGGKEYIFKNSLTPELKLLKIKK